MFIFELSVFEGWETLCYPRNNSIPFFCCRLNPLYQDEEGNSLIIDTVAEFPESPPTDHNSVRSSGYGSKENDSGSDISENSAEQENENDPPKRRSRKKRSQQKNLDVNEIVLNPKSLGIDPNSTSMRRSYEDLQSNLKKHDHVIYTDLDPVLYQKNPRFVGSVQIGLRRTRSLETVQEVNDESDSPRRDSGKSPSPVPAPVWPKVSNLAETLQRQSDKIYTRRMNEARKIHRSSSLDHKPVIRFNPLVSVVTQNSRYVTAISVSPRKLPPSPKTISLPRTGEKITYFSNDNEEPYSKSPFSEEGNEEERISRYFSNALESHQYSDLQSEDYPVMSLQPDSLVTEDTLKMMTYSDYQPHQTHPSPVVPKALHSQDVGQVMYTRGLYATLNRNSLLQTEEMVRPPFKSRRDTRKIVGRINSTASSNVKKKGIDAVRDLWEKTGLKTNGRKLLVDIDDVISERQDEVKQGRLRCSGVCRINGNCDCMEGDGNRHPKLSRTENYFISTRVHGDADEASRSLSSMSMSSDRFRKNYNNSLISRKSRSGSEDPNSSSLGTSLENFGIDNFAFEDDSGNRTKASCLIRNKAALTDSPYSSSSSSDPENHVYSELQEVVVHSDKLNKNEDSSPKNFSSRTPDETFKSANENPHVWTVALEDRVSKLISGARI